MQDVMGLPFMEAVRLYEKLMWMIRPRRRVPRRISDHFFVGRSDRQAQNGILSGKVQE